MRAGLLRVRLVGVRLVLRRVLRGRRRRRCRVAQDLLESRDDHLKCDGVEPGGDDDVGVALGGLDKLVVHWTHRLEVLRDHRAHLATALRDVALEPADEAHVGVRVHKDFNVQQLAQLRMRINQDALDNHHARRRLLHCLRAA